MRDRWIYQGLADAVLTLHVAVVAASATRHSSHAASSTGSLHSVARQRP